MEKVTVYEPPEAVREVVGVLREYLRERRTMPDQERYDFMRCLLYVVAPPLIVETKE